MISRAGQSAFAAILILTPMTALAGDGSFGVPASGILMPPPPARTAALIPPDRADLDKQRPVQRVQQTYSPAPAEGAGRSRVVPPSEAPEHSPIVVPPKKKQFKAPIASVDPSYVERVEGDSGSDRQPAVASAPMPVMAQGAAPEPKRGLFGMLRNRGAQTAQAQPAPVYTSSASAAYDEHVTTAPVRTAYAPQAVEPRAASRFSFGGAKPSARASDGTPCGQLRGIFTSPPECR